MKTSRQCCVAGGTVSQTATVACRLIISPAPVERVTISALRATGH